MFMFFCFGSAICYGCDVYTLRIYDSETCVFPSEIIGYNTQFAELKTESLKDMPNAVEEQHRKIIVGDNSSSKFLVKFVYGVSMAIDHSINYEEIDRNIYITDTSMDIRLYQKTLLFQYGFSECNYKILEESFPKPTILSFSKKDTNPYACAFDSIVDNHLAYSRYIFLIQVDESECKSFNVIHFATRINTGNNPDFIYDRKSDEKTTAQLFSDEIYQYTEARGHKDCYVMKSILAATTDKLEGERKDVGFGKVNFERLYNPESEGKTLIYETDIFFEDKEHVSSTITAKAGGHVKIVLSYLTGAIPYAGYNQNIVNINLIATVGDKIYRTDENDIFSTIKVLELDVNETNTKIRIDAISRSLSHCQYSASIAVYGDLVSKGMYFSKEETTVFSNCSSHGKVNKHGLCHCEYNYYGEDCGKKVDNIIENGNNEVQLAGKQFEFFEIEHPTYYDQEKPMTIEVDTKDVKLLKYNNLNFAQSERYTNSTEFHSNTLFIGIYNTGNVKKCNIRIRIPHSTFAIVVFSIIIIVASVAVIGLIVWCKCVVCARDVSEKSSDYTDYIEKRVEKAINDFSYDVAKALEEDDVVELQIQLSKGILNMEDPKTYHYIKDYADNNNKTRISKYIDRTFEYPVTP